MRMYTCAYCRYSAGGFSLEKLEISALKEIETIAKPGAEDGNVRISISVHVVMAVLLAYARCICTPDAECGVGSHFP